MVLAHVGPSTAQALADSELHARKALSLDRSLASAHAALAHSYWQQWRWSEADDEFRQAISGTGNTAIAHQLYGLYLASLGRDDEAVQHARFAVELQPVSGLANFSLAQVYLQAGDFAAAVAQSKKTLLIDRNFPLALQSLIRAEIQLGRLEEAQRDLTEAIRSMPGTYPLEQWQSYLLARSGRLRDAREVFQLEEKLGPNHPHPSLGGVAALLAIGDRPAALQALQASIAAHVPSMTWVWVIPELQVLRSDPQFITVASRVRQAPLNLRASISQ